MHIRNSLIIIVISTVSGCATIVGGTSQDIAVATQNNGGAVNDAHCLLTNDRGHWEINTPGTVSVHRSYGNLTVKCQKDGLPDGLVTANSTTKGAVAGNILLGGGLGAGVDVANGAAFDYPSSISVEMGKSIDLSNPGTKGLAQHSASAPTTQAAPQTGMHN